MRLQKTIQFMKNHLTKLALVVAVTSLLIASCSKEETKKQNQAALRPSAPENNDVQIGTQVWMKRNLNVSRYRNGDPIPQVGSLNQWVALTTGAWCYYANNTANGLVYGKLYNWYAVNDPRGLAPVGYHIPKDFEWSRLTTYLGGLNIAGGKMKAVDPQLWTNLSGNIGATNSSGFTGLPGGVRVGGSLDPDRGTFLAINISGYWWSSTASNATEGRFIWLRNGNSAEINSSEKTNGYSVRCLKGEYIVTPH